jgi:hypothetical protein
MTQQDQDLKAEHYLQMFTYYFTIAWQILAAFGAAGLVVFLVPFAISRDVFLTTPFFQINFVFAAVLVFIGVGFFDRYQRLAHRWVHNEFCPPWLEERINTIEWGQLYYPRGHETASPPLRVLWWRVTPRQSAMTMLAIVALWMLFYAIFSILAWYQVKPC